MAKQLPEYPGQANGGAFAKKPNPPKFLEVQSKDGRTKIIKVGMQDEPLDGPQLKIIQPQSQAKKDFPLVSAKLTSSQRAPPRPLDSEPHRFHAVDSRADCKPERPEEVGFNVLASRKPKVIGGAMSSQEMMMEHQQKPPVDFVGSTFHHVPNAPSLQILQQGWRVPKITPTLPRPFVPASPASFDDYGKLHQRTADGRILGKDNRKFCDEAHVPYHPEPHTISSLVASAGGTVLTTPAARDRGRGQFSEVKQHYDVSGVNERNNVVQLDATWSACWDGEAAAVYYYNHLSGEATWIPPEKS